MIGIFGIKAKELGEYWSILKNKLFWKSYMFYLSFPLLLILIFILLGNKIDFFNLRFPVRYIWTVYTHSFFHSNWEHLVGNVKSYLILITINLIIFYRIKQPTKLRNVFWIIIIFTPFISSIANYFLIGTNLKPMVGSSDIISALLGFTFLSMFLLVCNDLLEERYSKLFLAALYLVSLLVVIDPPFDSIKRAGKHLCSY
jgi:membrane associated rhomboid family serine protease